MRFITSQMFDIRHRTYEGELDIERIRRIKPLLDLRGIPPTQPSLPRAVVVEKTTVDPAAHVPLRRQGHLNPRSKVQAVSLPMQRKPLPVPKNLPAVYQDEPLSIPVRRGFVFPWSFALSVLLAMFLVPTLAFIGSTKQLESGLRASVAEAAEILETATRAMASLDTSTAQGAFAAAANQFQSAQAALADVGFGTLNLIAEFPISAKLTSGKAVLLAGEHLALAGEALARATAALTSLEPDQFLSDVFSFAVVEKNLSGVHESGIAFEDALLVAAAHLEAAADALERVDLEAVPEEYRVEMVRLKEGIPTIRSSVAAIHGHARSIAGFLGMREVRRYLVLLQNATEIRPTGGFIGNVALLTVANGQIIKLEVDDTYRFDGQIIDYTVPPKPIQDISSAWSLHDSNWYRDFPTSAALAADFYEEQGGATPDGVVAITSKMMERILAALGSVTLDDGTTIDADSLVDILNATGAAQRPGETTQVRLVNELLPKIIESIAQSDSDMRARLADAVASSVAAGDMQVWLRNRDEQELVANLGMTGEVPKDFRGDVLGVVHANINGYKSERVIGESVLHEASVSADGSVSVRLTLTRHHHGDAAEGDYYKQVSKSYTRFLVPRGVTVTEADGFTCITDDPIRARDYEALDYRISTIVATNEATLREVPGTCATLGEENGLGVIGGWIFVSPGETKTVQLAYELPDRLDQETDSYRLLTLKQPGFESAFQTTLEVDPVWDVVWTSSDYDDRMAKLQVPASPLTENRFFGAVLTKE